MGTDQTEHTDLPAVSPPNRSREPLEGEFRVLWTPLYWLRAYWWAIGAYVAYCAVIWGLAALAGWVL